MVGSRLWWLGVALASAPMAASAQAAAPKPAEAAKPATPAKPAGKTVEAITVTGSAPDVRTSIDKQSYTLGKDLQATTGSIADALRNVPAVEVDLQGNLSLRGDGNVTILVDGKPSAVFEGKGRAEALQQLPADQIERVEVITNPSAALNPEGTGGVINLISKQSRGGGITGSTYVTAASAGLKRTGFNFGYNSKTLAITGALAVNYQRNKQHNTDERDALDPASGQFLKNFDEGLGRNLTRGLAPRINLSWNATAKDQITAAFSYNTQIVHGHPDDKYVFDGADGQPVLIRDRSGRRRFLDTDNSVSAGWRHTFGEGHQLSVDAIYNDSIARDHTLDTTFVTLPPTPVPLELIRNDDSRHHTELRVAYSRGVAGGTLNAGYELRREDNDENYSDAMGPTQQSLVLQPQLANHYLYTQTVHSLYATYQHRYGDLDAQLGLRLEDVRFTLAQLTSGERDGQHYGRAYPTLHLNYKLDDDRKLTASYSVRVQRPPSVFLNPLIYVNGPQDIQVGNPRLRVKEVHIYELGYLQHAGSQDYQANFYVRDVSGEFGQIIRDLGGGVFETTIGNAASSRIFGMDLSANGKLGPSLTYSASAGPYRYDFDAGNLGVGLGKHSVSGVGGRINLNWQASANDMVQLNAIETGRRIVAQGAVERVFSLNMGWRHKINERITATMTAQDLLASNRFQLRLKTPTLTERLDVLPVSRAIFFRLDYRFGGGAAKAVKDPGFEYENSGGPG